MDGIITNLSSREKRNLEQCMRNCKEAQLKTRYLIVLNLAEGFSPTKTAKAHKVARSTVYRVAERFRQQGEAGLIDQRQENGTKKLSGEYLTLLRQLVGASPQQYGYPRPTWTRELFIQVMQQLTGVKVSLSTMSRALRVIKARRGRPRPTVESTWSKRAKNRRLRAIQQLINNLPEDEVVVYEDEVDIHLNPKIGLDWMLPRQQKQVLTPGKNKKQYLAGALNPQTGELIWVAGERKNTLLFLEMLWQLHLHYDSAKRIHVILDNYSIHSTGEVEHALATVAGQRLVLHFLPPYCPDHNRIERVWQDLHANVTRNHTNREIESLMQQVHNYLHNRTQQQKSKQSLAV